MKPTLDGRAGTHGTCRSRVPRVTSSRPSNHSKEPGLALGPPRGGMPAARRRVGRTGGTPRKAPPLAGPVKGTGGPGESQAARARGPLEASGRAAGAGGRPVIIRTAQPLVRSLIGETKDRCRCKCWPWAMRRRFAARAWTAGSTQDASATIARRKTASRRKNGRVDSSPPSVLRATTGGTSVVSAAACPRARPRRGVEARRVTQGPALPLEGAG